MEALWPQYECTRSFSPCHPCKTQPVFAKAPTLFFRGQHAGGANRQQAAKPSRRARMPPAGATRHLSCHTAAACCAVWCSEAAGQRNLLPLSPGRAPGGSPQCFWVVRYWMLVVVMLFALQQSAVMYVCFAGGGCTRQTEARGPGGDVVDGCELSDGGHRKHASTYISG